MLCCAAPLLSAALNATLRGAVLRCAVLQAAEQLAELRQFRQKMEEAQSEGDPQAQAEQMLKMKTVKVQKAK